MAGISMGGWNDPFYAPFAPASYFYADCYSPFSYGYASAYNPCLSYYSPFGYYGYGYYPGYPYYGGGGWVDVGGPGGGGGWGGGPGGGGPPTPVPEGRVINGRGYTQVVPRVPETPGIRVGGTGHGDASSGGQQRRVQRHERGVVRRVFGRLLGRERRPHRRAPPPWSIGLGNMLIS